jgi:hypothetical protein
MRGARWKSGVAVVVVVFSQAALAEPEFVATLAGHAVLPAASFFPAPVDAPNDLKVSGKYTTGQRVDAVNSVEGRSGGRPTGLKLPFNGQPIQGHSGIKRMADGSYWIISDNGFGSRANSPDAMLFLRNIRVDWEQGSIETARRCRSGSFTRVAKSVT